MKYFTAQQDNTQGTQPRLRTRLSNSVIPDTSNQCFFSKILTLSKCLFPTYWVQTAWMDYIGQGLIQVSSWGSLSLTVMSCSVIRYTALKKGHQIVTTFWGYRVAKGLVGIELRVRSHALPHNMYHNSGDGLNSKETSAMVQVYRISWTTVTF